MVDILKRMVHLMELDHPVYVEYEGPERKIRCSQLIDRGLGAPPPKSKRIYELKIVPFNAEDENGRDKQMHLPENAANLEDDEDCWLIEMTPVNDANEFLLEKMKKLFEDKIAEFT